MSADRATQVVAEAIGEHNVHHEPWRQGMVPRPSDPDYTTPTQACALYVVAALREAGLLADAARTGYAEMVLRALVSSPTLPEHNRVMVRDALSKIDQWEHERPADHALVKVGDVPPWMEVAGWQHVFITGHRDQVLSQQPHCPSCVPLYRVVKP